MTKKFSVSLLIIICGALTVPAAVRTWDGGGTNSLWSNAINWAGNVAPLAGDDLVFPSGAAQANNCSNNFAAGTVFNSITISSNNYALTGNRIAINNGVHGTLASASANITIPLTLTKAQSFTNSGNGRLIYNSPITNGGFTLTLEVTAGTNLFQTGAGIAGTGGLIKNGSGLLRFTGPSTNTYGGTTTVNGGTVELAKTTGVTCIPGDLIIGDNIGGVNSDVVIIAGGHQIADTAEVTINGSGQLNIVFGDTIGGLTGTGRVLLSNNHLYIDLLSGTNTFSGMISNTAAGLGVNKYGAGTMILNGSSPYTGLTSINGGILRINGNQTNSDVFLGGGSRLEGIGSVGNIEINGSGSVLAPGTGSGSGALICKSYKLGVGSSSLEIELNGLVAVSGYNQLWTSGTNNLSGITLNASLNFPSARSNQFMIVTNRGTSPVVAGFSGLAEGAIKVIGGEQFRISYVGGDGNDVVLTQISGQLPKLFIERIPTNMVRLSWPTNVAAGFSLQSITNITSTNWSTFLVTDFPVMGTNHVFTNTITGPARYYRLRK